ncbi:hypothetical protein [uncultured Brevibacterium sp.]|uniref:hypothetical protein n=1 Tax=uncultured Brevibacterium sp. TaxID=189678 RepID=UPI0025D0EC55|nr:hypothetical protein [uncultured Brevibacterium sp.]
MSDLSSLWETLNVNEIIWGFTSGQWGAVAAIGSLITAIITYRVAAQNRKLTLSIHRLSGPYPVMDIIRARSTSSSEPAHLMIVRVENIGRITCEVSPPVIDTKRNGKLVVVDPHLRFEGPTERVCIEPSKHVDWTLDIDKLSEADKKRVVYVHLETRATGGNVKRQKVLLGDSWRLIDRLPLLWH